MSGAASMLAVPRGGGGTIEARVYSASPGSSRPPDRSTLILAPGAGAGQRHPFMTGVATALAARGLDVVTFDFPYMTEGRRVPDRAAVLEQVWRDVVGHLAGRGGSRLVVGGKSMGGRLATHVMAAPDPPPAAGVVLLGYPLQPPRRPGVRRDAHLGAVAVPMLFVQGERDEFGGRDELAALTSALGSRATLHVVAGADHAFRVSRAVIAAQGDVLSAAWDVVAGWIDARVGRGGMFR